MTYEDLVNSSNFPVYEDIPFGTPSQQIFCEIFFILFAIIGILGDVLIIYTIFKFQKLKTVSNIFLANWAIADILSVFVAPSGYQIMSLVGSKTIMDCILTSLRWDLFNNVFIFIILVCFNWMLESYFKEFYSNVKQYYQITIGVLWFIILGIIFINTKPCFSHSYHQPKILFMSALICTGFVICLQITQGLTKWRNRTIENSSLLLNISTLHLVVIWIIEFTFRVSSQYFLQFITECVLLLSSFITLAMLYFFDKDFQACFSQVLKCSRGGYHETPALYFQNPIVHGNARNEKSSEEVAFVNQDDTMFEI